MYRDQPHPCYPENRTEDGCYPENRNEEEGCYPQPPGGGRSLLERWLTEALPDARPRPGKRRPRHPSLDRRHLSRRQRTGAGRGHG